MSIINSFKKDDKEMIKVANVVNKSEIVLSSCIINFSSKIMDALIENDIIELIDDHSIHSISIVYPLYVIKNTNIGIIKTTVGAPATAGLVEEISYMFSCTKFVMFGSCGGLDKTISLNKIIVPTEAYRDEGISYHYAEPSDYIAIKNHNVVCKILDELNIDYVKGKVWTTDAFYRETEGNYLARKKEGCIAVEMELSAIQAVTDFRNLELYNFLYRSDNLDCEQWEKVIPSQVNRDDRLKSFFVALEIAKRI